jgi:hypothetical protein
MRWAHDESQDEAEIASHLGYTWPHAIARVLAPLPIVDADAADVGDGKPKIDCCPRTAVLIVSADSLCKTEIFADRAGDFSRFLP